MVFERCGKQISLKGGENIVATYEVNWNGPQFSVFAMKDVVVDESITTRVKEEKKEKTGQLPQHSKATGMCKREFASNAHSIHIHADSMHSFAPVRGNVEGECI